MKLNNVNKFPNNDYDYYELEELSDYDVEDLEKESVDEAWYWYARGSYEGCGHVIAKLKDGSWHHHDCGHCSCYGPCDNVSFTFEDRYTLQALYDTFSTDLKREVADIMAAIKADGNDVKLTRENQ